ncbi:MAG: GNAT family N-acetyltransferase [Bacteriovoracaceae bacterium]|nr:GNAT family N-acetyltransferase [Bacteriovoracaceae bacterium]
MENDDIKTENTGDTNSIFYNFDNSKDGITNSFGENIGDHLHLDNGFIISAACNKKVIGFISVLIENLEEPIANTKQAFIDIIKVRPEYRRTGIASRLIEIAIQKSSSLNLYQIAAWSSEDKVEAIPMWKKLGFGLCFSSIISGRTGEKVYGYLVAKPLMK